MKPVLRRMWRLFLASGYGFIAGGVMLNFVEWMAWDHHIRAKLLVLYAIVGAAYLCGYTDRSRGK